MWRQKKTMFQRKVWYLMFMSFCCVRFPRGVEYDIESWYFSRYCMYCMEVEQSPVTWRLRARHRTVTAWLNSCLDCLLLFGPSGHRVPEVDHGSGEQSWPGRSISQVSLFASSNRKCLVQTPSSAEVVGNVPARQKTHKCICFCGCFSWTEGICICWSTDLFLRRWPVKWACSMYVYDFSSTLCTSHTAAAVAELKSRVDSWRKRRMKMNERPRGRTLSWPSQIFTPLIRPQYQTPLACPAFDDSWLISFTLVVNFCSAIWPEI